MVFSYLDMIINFDSLTSNEFMFIIKNIKIVFVITHRHMVSQEFTGDSLNLTINGQATKTPYITEAI